MKNVQLLTPADWKDYALLDSGDGEKLEQFGEYRLSRPDPQILWKKSLSEVEWRKSTARFVRSIEDKGNWQTYERMREEWPVRWRDITLMARLSPFKHTGIFPEQSAHWQWFGDLITQACATPQSTPPNVLNLFAYTGGASVVAAKRGAKITHVDASRSSISWAKKNQLASGLDDRSIRWILDDVVTFVQREVKRGVKYDGIILDPPVYGHGPNGERWEFKSSLPELLRLCQEILSEKPLFVLINAYAVSTSAVTLENLLADMMMDKGGSLSSGELALEQQSGRMLSTGIWARWQR
ncbi:class I SAM-dependent methyltransferase [Candidatus Woesebacteria bacterium]|nr:class I SAM-dependent methyltransferase [Candidatus Woesebacteria bacterium]